MKMKSVKTLEEWLHYCEKLHPKSIDMGLERPRAVLDRMGLKLECVVISVAGTNGKGSTCAMLESILRHAGYRTAVYTSPHLVHFEERLRLDGEAVQASVLLPSFERVEKARLAGADVVSLTFFEFTTLAFFDLISNSPVDVAILEVGLGGRLDAVNLMDADCAIITSIDLDHTQLLGETRELIGAEKAGILRPGKIAVVSDPVPPVSIIDIAARLGTDIWRSGVDFETTGDKQQWTFSTSPKRGSDGLPRRLSGLAYPSLRGANQLLNAAGVLAALNALRERLPVSAQAIRNGMATVELPGRFQIVPGQPTLILDVAHNPHAVSTLVANLDAMGYFPVTHAVFGAMVDKDIPTMLKISCPVIDRWYFTDLPTERADTAANLHAQFCSQSGADSTHAGVFSDPLSALRAALAHAEPTDRIAVFGSFYTVGAVLGAGLATLRAATKNDSTA